MNDFYYFNVSHLLFYYYYYYYYYCFSIKIDQIYAYGKPVDAEEYSFIAQLVQYQQYKALFEGLPKLLILLLLLLLLLLQLLLSLGFLLYQFKYYNAVIFWKSQSPWPTLRGNNDNSDNNNNKNNNNNDIDNILRKFI